MKKTNIFRKKYVFRAHKLSFFEKFFSHNYLYVNKTARSAK